VRVLVAHNRYRAAGGEERHIQLLCESLARAGAEVRLLEVPSPQDPSLGRRIELGLGLTYRPSGARRIHAALSDWPSDVVHFHNVFPLLTPAAMREAKRAGAAVAMTVHNYRFACPGGTLLRDGVVHEDCIDGSSLLCGLRNARGVWDESLAYGVAIELQRRLRLQQRWVDAFIAPGSFVIDLLVRAGYPPGCIHLIRHGVPTVSEVAPKERFVLYVGRLSPEKGVRTLLEASARAPEVRLVMVSTGPLAGEVRAAAARGSVEYLGYVSDEEVRRLRERALYTVVPSECYEVAPLGVLESFAAGTAVIAADLGGMAEVIEDGTSGLLVPPRSPAALSRAMRSLWNEPGRAEHMGAQALAFARAELDTASQARKMIALYESITSASPRPTQEQPQSSGPS
jgi:glycosyltransferase involved in cell wall biosynthesis